MTAMTPTFSQIRAMVHEKQPTRPLGIHTAGRWTSNPIQTDGDQRYCIYQCDSPLAMRLALRETIEPNAKKVLVTNLEDRELGDDVLMRLHRRKLYPIENWQIVRSLFQASAVDPRLTNAHMSWLADALLEIIPSDGYPPARGGFLDSETVWSWLLNQLLGLDAQLPDLTTLLKWSTTPDGIARFQRLAPALRDGAIEWLGDRAGTVAKLVLRSFEHLERPDAVAIGLAGGVVFHRSAAGRLDKATGKFEERFLGGQAPDDSIMVRWNAAATEVVRSLQHTDARLYRQIVQRADDILREVQADNFAYLSETLPLSFEQRLASFGQRLIDALPSRDRQGGDSSGQRAPLPDGRGSIEKLREAQQAVRAHDLIHRESRCWERVQMAVRLMRWLADRRSKNRRPPRSLGEAATDHLREGGYVDWARLALRAGDPVRDLSEAYTVLFNEVTLCREEDARTFAELLKDWTAAGSQSQDVLPVEQILEQIAAPLAAAAPVLVIVMDGMSVAVCRELLADVTRHEWIALCEEGRADVRPGLAMIPSVTEVSRTSLLCGQLRQGSANEERIGFAEHPALLAKSKTGYPPILFHKASLQDSREAVLAADIRREIESSRRRVVGVVVNAVDDHLLKGDQIDVRWTRDEIKVLPMLLQEARQAGRLVVLISDHGHVLDHQTVGRQCDGGERWRFDDGQPAADEIQFSGTRVFVLEPRPSGSGELNSSHKRPLPDGRGSTIIAPWSERVRYAGKKNGYHGGVSPQEMVIAISVLTATEVCPDGWDFAAVDLPSWWLDDSSSASAAKVEPAPRKPKKKSGVLFDLDESEQEGTPLPDGRGSSSGSSPTPLEPRPSGSGVVEPAPIPLWIRNLLGSAILTEQKRLCGRAMPADDKLAEFLAALDGRGGKMTSPALAKALQLPAFRLNSFVAVMQRVLNVDGYGVLLRDQASDSVELNRSLLSEQFALEEGP